uniref:Uncharacterized protein n=1 Tax=Vitis vinifera TaxID=29760 RepID=F6HBG3_VITVI
MEGLQLSNYELKQRCAQMHFPVLPYQNAGVIAKENIPPGKMLEKEKRI